MYIYIYIYIYILKNKQVTSDTLFVPALEKRGNYFGNIIGDSVNRCNKIRELTKTIPITKLSQLKLFQQKLFQQFLSKKDNLYNRKFLYFTLCFINYHITIDN